MSCTGLAHDLLTEEGCEQFLQTSPSLETSGNIYTCKSALAMLDMPWCTYDGNLYSIDRNTHHINTYIYFTPTLSVPMLWRWGTEGEDTGNTIQYFPPGHPPPPPHILRAWSHASRRGLALREGNKTNKLALKTTQKDRTDVDKTPFPTQINAKYIILPII